MFSIGRNENPHAEFAMFLTLEGIRMVPLNHKAVTILFVLDGEGEAIDTGFEFAASLLYDEKMEAN